MRNLMLDTMDTFTWPENDPKGLDFDHIVDMAVLVKSFIHLFGTQCINGDKSYVH